MVNEEDYVELGLTCATICTDLDMGLRNYGGQFDDLDWSVVNAIERLTM
jgi:hypothetical protein